MPDYALTWTILAVVWGGGLVYVNRQRRRTRLLFAALATAVAVTAHVGVALKPKEPVKVPQQAVHVEQVFPLPHEYIRGWTVPDVEEVEHDPDDER